MGARHVEISPDGVVVSLELDPRHAAIARANLEGCDLGDRVDVAGVEDQRARNQLLQAEAAGAVGDGRVVRGQAPAGIEGLAENTWLVTGKNRLKSQLR